jgi:hypothetical protein
MPRTILAAAGVLAISITASLFTPFCALRCKALFWGRDFCSGRIVYFLCVGMLSAGCMASAAAAEPSEPQCDRRAAVLEILQQRYGELPVALGVTNNGGLLEVLTAGNGSTWSIIVTTPQGMSCLVAAGQGWRVRQDAAPGPES